MSSNSAPLGSALREAARRAKNVWGAVRGMEAVPGQEGAEEGLTAAEEASVERRRDVSSPPEEVVSVREEVLKTFRDRLAILHRQYGKAPHVDALLRDLAQLHPGVIRQPAGVAPQVLEMLNRENYSWAQIGAVIEKDPAIAQALLNHANADWYEGDGAPPLSSLVAAARRVGSKGVMASVMTVVLERGAIRPGAGLDAVARMVWDHMVRVAPIARQFAHGFGVDPDSGFTLGLCHDAGKLLFFERVAEVRKALRADLKFPPGFMQAALKQLHEPLGGLAAFSWGMPPDFAAAIASHHRTGSGLPSSPLAEAVYAAERLDLMVHADRHVDLTQLWNDGAMTAPMDRFLPLWEQARQGAVARELEEKRRKAEAPMA